MKIDQYLTKLCADYLAVTFLAHPVYIFGGKESNDDDAYFWILRLSRYCLFLSFDWGMPTPSLGEKGGGMGSEVVSYVARIRLPIGSP